MTVKPQRFGIKSLLDAMHQTLNPVQWMRDHARRVAAIKARCQTYLRPCLEVLEDRITPSVPNLTTLANFDGTNGKAPSAGLIMDSSGNLYGTTQQGDTSVFELAKGSGTITTLASFNGTNGQQPASSLVMDSSGNLYGTTELGGTFGDGTVFELAKGSGTITALASFNFTEGSGPSGVIMDSSGNLYGTTEGGGAYNLGRVFELAKGSGTITTLASFNFTDGGHTPYGVIMDDSGNLYGTTYGIYEGSTYYPGTVFELAKGSGTITTLASCDGPTAGVIIDSSGNLYGTSGPGGTFGDGRVFELAKGSGTITTLASFNDNNGAPVGGVIMDSSGNLYGMAVGSDSNDGTVFELANGSGTITTLASFNGTNGYNPSGGVIMDSSGNLYGTTELGGTFFDGTVFELSLNQQTPMLTPTSLAWDNTQGGVDFSYNVSGNSVSTDTQVALYWSSSSQFSDAIGDPVYTQDIRAGTAIGSYGPFNVPAATLGVPPSEAKYLLAVTDPNNVLGNFDQSTNVASIAVPIWTGAGTTDLWSDGNNWLAGVPPTAGSGLIFPSGVLQETSVNDLGFTFGSIITSDAYSFSGQPLTANSIIVSQGSLELDSPTTVTNKLSVAEGATLAVGSKTTAGSLTVPSDATLSLDGKLIVNANATLEDDGAMTAGGLAELSLDGTLIVNTDATLQHNGTMTINDDGTLDDFGTVNMGNGGTITISQGLVLVAYNASFSNSGLVTVDADASLADEGTLSVINNGMLFNSGTISVGEGAVLSLSNGNGSIVDAPSSVMDVWGTLVVGSGCPLSSGGTCALDGIDDGIDNNPANSVLVSTPITPSTPSSTEVLQAVHQADASASPVFDTAEALAKDVANGIPFDGTQAAEKLASFAKGASHFALVAKYSIDISNLYTAYVKNNQTNFGTAYSQLTEDFNSDVCGLAVGGITGYVTAATSIADGGASAPAVPLAILLGNLGGSAAYEQLYYPYIRQDVINQGMALFTDLKNRFSTAPPGLGGTLNDQGSVTVSPTGILSDQDAITVATGATLSVFGNLTEGVSGAQQVFGTLVVEPLATLDIIGSVTIEPGGTFLPLGTVSVAPGGIANLSSGVNAFGNNLFIVGGQTTNDQVQVQPVGVSKTGNTGVQVNSKLNGVTISKTFNQSFNAIYIFDYAGDENINLASSLNLNSYITAGNGNDNVIVGNSNNSVALGNGNDNVIAGNGNNNVTLGNGNDNIIAGNGNNIVTLGNGNDNTLIGNGNNVIVEGNGHDIITAGNGDNLIVAGLGQHFVLVGNGSNILIDGSVQLTQIGDSLLQVLTDWIAYGATASNVASIRSRLSVTYNHDYVNTLITGRGLDWFWVMYAKDLTNRKATDLLN